MSIRQITRARRAAYLLRGGAGILRVAHDLGYFDQAHLSRSLKYFIGQTPAQIFRGERQLSLLYKTDEI
jgi:AraC-like DNA-binding protein